MRSWRLGPALLAFGATLGAQAASVPDGPVAASTLWSADGTSFACRSGRVEMIVGGTAQPADCSSSRAATTRANAGRDARVDASEQRARDVDRQAILQQEMVHEHEELARLGSAPPSEANRQALERTRTNLAALQRELVRAP